MQLNFTHCHARTGRDIHDWSLTKLWENLVQIGAKVTRHSEYVTFQLAEVAVTRNLFAAILDRIEWLALPPLVVDGSAVQEPEMVKSWMPEGNSRRQRQRRLKGLQEHVPDVRTPKLGPQARK